MDKNHLHVTCAIIEANGLVFAAQRSATMNLPLKWEFPGGKIHPGEEPEVCLKREIFEELGIFISVCEQLPSATHQYEHFSVTLYPFLCTIESGEIVLLEHADLCWLPAAQLRTLDWAEADLPVLERYLSKRSPLFA
ncbi:MAG: (deoxy)nucleoside triphosphate pyrophosphohydrolase [Desulfuromonadales bacterium]|nr:(deoxy)nucleoside triphosphate pyrophosphohydrolase [Desulfuromonadales bacterium]